MNQIYTLNDFIYLKFLSLLLSQIILRFYLLRNMPNFGVYGDEGGDEILIFFRFLCVIFYIFVYYSGKIAL